MADVQVEILERSEVSRSAMIVPFNGVCQIIFFFFNIIVLLICGCVELA